MFLNFGRIINDWNTFNSKHSNVLLVFLSPRLVGEYWVTCVRESSSRTQRDLFSFFFMLFHTVLCVLSSSAVEGRRYINKNKKNAVFKFKLCASVFGLTFSIKTKLEIILSMREGCSFAFFHDRAYHHPRICLFWNVKKNRN